MDQTSSRWHEITPSAFAHERAALAYVRDLLPDRGPYEAWSNFTFVSEYGHVREVDLLVLAPTGLFLIEVKNFHGKLDNQGAIWSLSGGRARTFDNPLPLADQKAKELKSLLTGAATRDRGGRVPFVRGCVFLAEPQMESRLTENQRHHVYVPDESRSAGLHERIGADLLLGPVRHAPPDPDFVRSMDRLLRRVGIHRTRRSVTVGAWQIEPRPFDTGPTWVDHHAAREDLPNQYRRVRIYLYEREADQQGRESVRHAAQRELLATQGIAHPGLLAPADLVDHELGPALLIEQHRDAQRLDHFLASDGAALDLTARLGLVRQLAEAVGYAHERRLVHRALSPRAVIVEPGPDGGWASPRLRVGEWQSAARGLSSTSSEHRVAPTTHAGRHVEVSAAVYLAPEFGNEPDGTTAIDLFGLGATSYLILTGKPPAQDRAALAGLLRTANGLHPGQVDESLPAQLDELVFESTCPRVTDRLADVPTFLEWLGDVLDGLAAETADDPFDAQEGTRLADGYVVRRVLGTGATARAFLVERDGHETVLKVGRSAAAEQRLDDEAITLEGIRHDHVVGLRRGAFALGAGRHAIEIDYAGEQTLGALLREDGVQLPDQLQSFGDQLLDAVGYLVANGVHHRDVKPDNLGVHRHPKRGPRLVLFDFSLAGASATDVNAGTRGYRDPFLGPPRRPSFDTAAELYAVAVTLHEMASLELPTWGEDGTDPTFADDVTVSSEVFDPGLRDGLVRFFRTALHRDIDQRFATPTAMREAWNQVFTAMDSQPPARTSHSDSDDPEEQRNEAADAATAQTALDAAGLSLRAVAVAQRLGADTVGDLVQVPTRALWRARGLSRKTRLELVNRVSAWRKRLADAPPVAPDDPEPGPTASPRALDVVAAGIVPAPATTRGDAVDPREVALALLGLPDGTGAPPAVRWPTMTDLAPRFGLTRARIGQLAKQRRKDWLASPALDEIRIELIDLLRSRDRVATAGELVADLLLSRGCRNEDDADRRWACGYAVLRAAVEADSLAETPRFATRRHADRMLVALQVAEDESYETPNDDELLDMASALADEAVVLAGTDPLPTPVAVVRALEGVTRRFEQVLPEQRMVQLAASATAGVRANARLELYPADLDAGRALRLSQAGAGIPQEGLTPEALARRVQTRFPGIAALPDGPELAELLRDLGFELRWDGDRLVPPSGTASSSHASSTGGAALIPVPSGETGPEDRLAHAVRVGGVRAVTFRRARWAAVRDRVTATAGVEPVDASVAFVEAMRAVARDKRIPDFGIVLAADAPDADPRSRTNLARVVEQAWARLEAQWVESDVLVLDGLTPFGRYAGGVDVLNRLLDSARRGGREGGPRVVVLLCAAQDENEPPVIGSQAVGLATSEEWVVAPSRWTAATAA